MDNAMLVREVAVLFLFAALVAGLINSFVLRSFSRAFKLRMLGIILLSATPIAYIFLTTLNLFITTILVCAWAIGSIFLIVHYGAGSSRLPKDWRKGINDSRTPATMAALMLTAFTFMMGFIVSKLDSFPYKIVVIGLLATPLVGAVSYIFSAYYVLESAFIASGREKDDTSKKAVMWWEIGQLLLLSTVLSLIPFIAVLLQLLVKL